MRFTILAAFLAVAGAALALPTVGESPSPDSIVCSYHVCCNTVTGECSDP
jgi:hypothetical protein